MIVQAGSNLYDTFVQFCDDLTDLQRKFGDLSSKFTTTINRFTRNSKTKPSIFSQVNALKDFGIISTKAIPNEFLSEQEAVITTSSETEILDGVLTND